jgi:hypothetical protein
LIVDQFLKLLDRLEALDEAEHRRSQANPAEPQIGVPAQLDAISATTAEEREFNELRRDLPRAASVAAATDVMFKHLRRVVPTTALALYTPHPSTNEIAIVSYCGVGRGSFEGLKVPVGERISGWAFAHSQVVINSDATLELGPVVRTFSTPIRYAAAVPLVDGAIMGVLLAFSHEPFERDHQRLFENAATLFSSSLGQVLSHQPSSDKSPTMHESIAPSRVH